MQQQQQQQQQRLMSGTPMQQPLPGQPMSAVNPQFLGKPIPPSVPPVPAFMQGNQLPPNQQQQILQQTNILHQPVDNNTTSVPIDSGLTNTAVDSAVPIT